MSASATMRRLIAACLIALAGCSSVPLLDSIAKPEVKDVRAHITGIDFQGVNLVFDVDVLNPYPVALTTPRFRYGIEVAGTSLAKSDSATSLSLPASGVGTAALPVRFRYADLMKLYGDLSTLNETDYKLTGALVFNAMNRSIEVPVSYAGKMPVLKVPTFSDAEVQADDISLTRAAVTVDANIGNPNVFELGLDGLGYSLKIGDIQVASISASTPGALAAGGTGKLRLTGSFSAASAAIQLLMGGRLGAVSIKPTGFVTTPYGKAAMP